MTAAVALALIFAEARRAFVRRGCWKMPALMLLPSAAEPKVLPFLAVVAYLAFLKKCVAGESGVAQMLPQRLAAPGEKLLHAMLSWPRFYAFLLL